MRALILALALLCALPAHAQDAPICSSGKAAASIAIPAQWHTTLAAGTSQPKLWQVGYLNRLPTYDLTWQPLMQFGVPYVRLAKREIVAVDLDVVAKSVEGGDVLANVGLFGLGDARRMSETALVTRAAASPAIADADFFEGDVGMETYWIDALIDPLSSAVAAREKSLSLFISPIEAGPDVASTTAQLGAAWLRIYHCPIER